MLSQLAEVMTPFLAFVVILGGFFLIYSRPDVKTEIIGLMTLVLSFYFGSSKGSQDKTKILAKEIKYEEETEKPSTPTGPDVPPVSVPGSAGIPGQSTG